MSLGCYPLSARSSLNLEAQPVSVDVSYEEDLFLCVADQGLGVAVYDLGKGRADVDSIENNPLLRCIKLGSNLVADQVIYCREGDYIACIANSDEGLDSIYVLFDWRDLDKEVNIREVDYKTALHLPTKGPLDDLKGQRKKYRNDGDNEWSEESLTGQVTESKLISMDCCQKTGNLGVGCGDIVQLYKFTGSISTNDSSGKPFDHIISVRLSINALSISFVENYLSIRASDHVQVLKLELLTLQIQSDGFDCCDAPCSIGVHCSASNSGTGDGTNPTACGDRLKNNTNNTTNSNNNNNNNNNNSNDHSSNNIGCHINNNAMMNGNCVQSGSHHGISFNERAEITWNLNTTKLVKLPTLMHNSSSNLDSYHICHPSELLGPASETIACRVSSSIYSHDLNQNQLELVVMLCKQFDSENERLLSAQLEPIYLGNITNNEQAELRLLKSSDYESLASVNCFVNTTNYCHVYSLHGKKAFKLQTIIHPDQCLHVQPDLLNAYLLNPLGLQVCSLGSCDQAFHYDWSSSGDLNLTFIGTDRCIVLATRNYIILISNSHQSSGCLVEYMEKPSLVDLYSCISYTVGHCDNNSIRTNLLTYLHATCHLTLARSSTCDQKADANVTDILKRVSLQLSKQLLNKKQTNVLTNNLIDKTIKHLLDISKCDLPELIKRTNSFRKMMNKQQKVDMESDLKIPKSTKAISTFADLNSHDFDHDTQDTQIYNPAFVSRRKWTDEQTDSSEHSDKLMVDSLENDVDFVDYDQDETATMRNHYLNHELIKIYMKHAQYSQSLLEYLVSEAFDYEKSAWLISLLFEHNPSLLIKCAQRYPLTLSEAFDSARQETTTNNTIRGEFGATQSNEEDESRIAPAMHLLVDKLKLLAELDSTGINRATVLFTLAILYNALGERAKCLAALDHIKPLNHLAITMRSNWEVSHSIAAVVRQRYPDFVSTTGTSIASTTNNNNNNNQNNSISSSKSKWSRPNSDEDEEDDATLTSCSSSSSQLNLDQSISAQLADECALDEHETELASGDSYERKLKLVADLSTSQLLDFLTDLRQDESSGLFKGVDCFDESEAERNLLEASINLLESKFILNRLRENCN